jgi:transcriptional regulator with XRE-family HTH domain
VPKDTTWPDLEKLGKRIKDLRVDKGLTQTDLSRASGVSSVYLSRIERGIRNLTALHRIAIATRLKLAPGALID